MSFFFGDAERGASLVNGQLVVNERGRFTGITVDVELRDLLLRELLGDDVLDGTAQERRDRHLQRGVRAHRPAGRSMTAS